MGGAPCEACGAPPGLTPPYSEVQCTLVRCQKSEGGAKDLCVVKSFSDKTRKYHHRHAYQSVFSSFFSPFSRFRLCLAADQQIVAGGGGGMHWRRVPGGRRLIITSTICGWKVCVVWSQRRVLKELVYKRWRFGIVREMERIEGGSVHPHGSVC